MNGRISTSRLVRVFISSTFRDFIQERDELVKKVFPELRRRCKERFVELLEVDLRWGITEEQAEGGETLRICLEEIDRCRPSAPVFFVGLLGERYGWVPPKSYFKQDVLEDPNLGWVKEHIDGKSVTELEVLHGVLRNEAMRDKAFFYFRKDGYQGSNWSEIQKYHAAMKPPVEVQREDFTNDGSERGKEVDDEKQRKLKQAVRDASLKWEPRDYEVPGQMAAMVLEDLWKAIDEAFPEEKVPGDTERRRLEHEAFGQSRVAGYIPRPALFAKLDQWLTAPSSAVCVVTGESGSGKSALLAAWLAQLGNNAPKHRFIHYIGGTPESSTARSIVFRLLHEIRDWVAVTDPVPDDFSEAVAVLPEWLRRAGEGKGGSVLLVLDALNQLENEAELGLGWLPKELPPGVRLLVSTLPGKAEDELRQRKWMGAPVEVPTLETAERRSIIEHFLREAGKNPDAIPVDKLANAPQSANALYLRVVLNELKLRASFGKVEELLDDLLEAKDPSELFVRVLKNLEEFDRERPDLVRESLGYLGLARRGLTEGELLELLSDAPNPSSSPLPRHYWSPLYLALADSLVSRTGQLGFFHDYLKKAVESEYLDEDRERKKIHGCFGEVALAWNSDRFGPALRDYALEHGIGHLLEAGEIDAAVGLCLDDGFFEASRSRLGSAGPFMQTLQAATEQVAGLCPEIRDLEAALCRLALRQGKIRARLSQSLAHDDPRPSALTSEAAEASASSSRSLPLQHQWFYALGLLADSAESNGNSHRLAEALRIFSRDWPEAIDFSSETHHDAWSHFGSGKEIQEVRELLIPELLARIATRDADCAASLLVRIDEGNRITQLCRCLIRLARHGRVDAGQKLMHHPLVGWLFETKRPAGPVYTIPVLWAFCSSQPPALREPKMIEAIERGLNLHEEQGDPWTLLSSALSTIVGQGFEPPDSLKQMLQDMWESAPLEDACGGLRFDMENEKEHELNEFEGETCRMMEEDRPHHEIAQREEQRQNLRKAPPSFHGWWSKHGAPEDLPSWLQLPARELYPRLLKQAGQGTKESTRLRSCDTFRDQLVLLYHESERLGVLSDAEISALAEKLTCDSMSRSELAAIKHCAVEEITDEYLTEWAAQHQRNTGESIGPDRLKSLRLSSNRKLTADKLAKLASLYATGGGPSTRKIKDHKDEISYDLFASSLDYWSAAAAVVGLIAVKLRVDGTLPAPIIKSIDEFAAAGQTTAQER